MKQFLRVCVANYVKARIRCIEVPGARVGAIGRLSTARPREPEARVGAAGATVEVARSPQRILQSSRCAYDKTPNRLLGH